MKTLTALNKLYEQLRHLPGIGSKTAMKLAYHIIDLPLAEVQTLAASLVTAKTTIKLC